MDSATCTMTSTTRGINSGNISETLEIISLTRDRTPSITCGNAFISDCATVKIQSTRSGIAVGNRSIIAVMTLSTSSVNVFIKSGKRLSTESRIAPTTVGST